MDNGYRKDGVYVINPSSMQGEHFSVYCQFQRERGIAWTVIQRRVNGLVDFNRNWTEYENGFGFLNGSFWLGLWKMHALTFGRKKILKLHIDLKTNTTEAFARYGEFGVESNDTDYKLHIAEFDGNSTAPDSLTVKGDGTGNIHGMKFTTNDKDNDDKNNQNCAQAWEGGWWFKACHDAHPNGVFPPPSLIIYDCNDYRSYAKYLTWKKLNNCYGDIIYIEMKIGYNY